MIEHIQQQRAAKGMQRQQRRSSQPSSRHMISIFDKKRIINKSNNLIK
jgi:hypothetical protein